MASKAFEKQRCKPANKTCQIQFEFYILFAFHLKPPPTEMGRLCAIADSFSAMITVRPYAGAKDPLEAAKEIANDSRYDPRYSPLLRNALVTKEITMNPPQVPEGKS